MKRLSNLISRLLRHFNFAPDNTAAPSYRSIT
jgi:hypothetical protein